ncbi:MAG: type I restriction endonuclease subunit R [Burkholderiales bacterium]|nr:type I restriction endonuclease subunit R [Burkholderiales bacterium]
MTKLTESTIENWAIELLQAQGYTYLYGPDIAPESATAERARYDEVVLVEHLRAAVRRINPLIPIAAQDEAIAQVLRIASPDVLANNEAFHRLLTEGVPVTVQVGGESRGDFVRLVDFDTVDVNDFVVVNQFTITHNHQSKRPDVVVFVNGLPLVVLELKNAADENASVNSAHRQLETYMQAIPSLFTFNAFSVISDGLEARAGTISAGLSRFMMWKSADGVAEASRLQSQLEVLIAGMLNRETLLDLVRSFVVFEKTDHTDADTGLIRIQTVKKIAAYHQYYAVNKAVASTIRAASSNGDRKGGVVWHTQGSGKSLSMVFYTGKVVRALDNPTVVVITDRNDLDDQLFDTFTAAKQLLRQEPKQVNSRAHLRELLSVASGGVVFTTIQKFQPESGNVFDALSERRNIVVIADEAHRTQYGFEARTVDDKDASGQVVGQKLVYGFAKYLRDALPSATYLGFTGTPIEGTDVNTPAVFGDYVDVYDIAQAVEDGATVKIYYESRLAKVALSEEGRRMVRELDAELEQEELTESQKAKAKWTRMEALIGSEQRIENIARDIIEHFEARQAVFAGKAMVVCMSRRIAAQLYEAMARLRPDWHSDDLMQGQMKVVMTASSDDGALLSKHHTSKEQRRKLAERMKDAQDSLKLVIVRDMWLTGFDAPSMHTLYIDKPMQGHNLMQAIARVNRVYGDKPGGLVVDYLGIASDLKKALSFYSDAGGKGDPALAQEQAVALVLEKIAVLNQMLAGVSYRRYFMADVSGKLSVILEIEDYILGLDNGKKRFIDEVSKLSQAFAIAVPHEQAMAVNQEVAFFQAVKARLVKFDQPTGSGRSNAEIESTIRQVIDKALVSEQVVDVFDAAGIKKPEISILSDEFLGELNGYKHKNLALEMLKKLLNDEIKSRARTNLVQSRSLMEMLQSAIQKYQNKILTAAEVMEELIKIGKEIVSSDALAKDAGLSTLEYAFYTAVANNNSARELMTHDKLRELAVVLTERVRANATIDWTIKESVRAQLRVIVKRTLRQFGYPPDMELLATETVLQQAEMIAGELNHD